MLRALARSLNLRDGEGRLLAALGGFLFLTIAADTLLSAGKNSLFLSVYDPGVIPWAMVGAALLAAVTSVTLGAVSNRFQRRAVAIGLTMTLGGALLVGWLLFRLDARWAFAVYLIASAVQVLVLTHAWDYIGDLLTGRQAKRLVPLIGGGGSLAAILSGVAVAPLAFALGSASMIWLSGALLFFALTLLWTVREPEREVAKRRQGDPGALGQLLRQAGRGFRNLGGHPLLRLLTAVVILVMLTATLIDFQFKLAIQAAFEQDRIAVAYGLLEAAAGVGALLVQIVASRLLIPKLGVSATSMLHLGSLGSLAVAVAATGGLWLVAALRFLDEVLQDSIQMATEQVSLLPFPARLKTAAFTTLDGVVRPLTEALGALAALALLTRPEVLPWLTAVLALSAFAVMTRHRARYMAALEEALTKHQVDFASLGSVEGLVADRTAIEVVERGLEDPDPAVVVFSLSLMESLRPADRVERTLPLLDHETPEVRIAAAQALETAGESDEPLVRSALVERLEREEGPQVLSRYLRVLSAVSAEDPEAHLRQFLDHPSIPVRRAALLGLAHREAVWARNRLDTLLHSEEPDEREVALGVVGELAEDRFLPVVTQLIADDRSRTPAVDALTAFGQAALPALDSLLVREDLPLPVKRTLITALSSIDDPGARGRLLQLVVHPRLGPAALTSLKRLRAAGRMEPVELHSFRPLLRAEVNRGARFALLGAALDGNDPERVEFVLHEMNELRIRHTHRALAVLTLVHDPGQVTAIQRGLFSGSPSRRSNALEFLEGMLHPEDAVLMIPLAEYEPGEPLEALVDIVGDGKRISERPLDVLSGEEDWWPRALAAHGMGRPIPPRRPGMNETEEGRNEMIPLIEKVMILKGSDLFRNFPGDELAGIAELSAEVMLEQGKVLFEQGDEGDAYYLVIRGAISIIRDGHELAVLGPREGFGEMAILDRETRSATARAAEATTMLRIDRDSFDQLVERNPAVARGIYRVLNQRLRNTLARIAAGS